MTRSKLQLIDDSAFPNVSLNANNTASGGVEAMIGDFELLLSDGQSFVLTMAGSDENRQQSQADQKQWVLWLKENRLRMASTCKGVVLLARQDKDIDQQHKQAAGMEGMMGIPVRIVGDAEEANAVSASLLG